MKIISVMTTDSSGGAEFAALEMLEALRDRGHDTVMLSDMQGIGRDTGVTVVPVSLGPKLSTGSWIALAARWPVLLARLRSALRAQAPYDVLMVHYKKEQLLVPFLPRDLRSTIVWAEWGPVPVPTAKGPAQARLSGGRAPHPARDGRIRGNPPVGHRGWHPGLQGDRRAQRPADR